MKRLLSTACSETSFNIAVLILRVTFGMLLLVNHGIDKLKHFAEKTKQFSRPHTHWPHAFADAGTVR